MRVAARTAALLLLPFAALGVAAVPEDVADHLHEQAAQADGTVARMLPVHGWTEAFLDDADGEAVESTGAWVAAIVTDSAAGDVVATSFKGPDGRLAGRWDHDPEVAAALIALPEDARVVSDGPIRGWYAQVGDELLALNERARGDIGERLPIGEAREAIAERWAGLGGVAPPPGGPVFVLTAIGLALAIGVGVALLGRAQLRGGRRGSARGQG